MNKNKKLCSKKAYNKIFQKFNDYNQFEYNINT